MKKSLLVSIVAILIGEFFVSSVLADDKRHTRHLGKIQGRNWGYPYFERGPRRRWRCYYHPKHGPRGQFSWSDLEDRRSQGQGGG